MASQEACPLPSWSSWVTPFFQLCCACQHLCLQTTKETPVSFLWFLEKSSALHHLWGFVVGWLPDVGMSFILLCSLLAWSPLCSSSFPQLKCTLSVSQGRCAPSPSPLSSLLSQVAAAKVRMMGSLAHCSAEVKRKVLSAVCVYQTGDKLRS